MCKTHIQKGLVSKIYKKHFFHVYKYIKNSQNAMIKNKQSSYKTSKRHKQTLYCKEYTDSI